MKFSINAQPREAGHKNNTLRNEGKIPAVFYGPQEDTTSIVISEGEFLKVFNKAGTSTIINLEGIGDTKEALVYDVQYHPVTGKVLHVDFYIIERGKKVSVEIPIEFVGEAPAEKKGFIVVKQMHELEIEVRPSQIPQSLEVDLSKLEGQDDVIVVGDIKLPESAEHLADKEEVVVSVVAQQEDQDEEERSVEDVVIEQKGKGEAEEASEN